MKEILNYIEYAGQLLVNIMFFIVLFNFLIRIIQLVFFDQERVYLIEIDQRFLLKKPIWNDTIKYLVLGFIALTHFDCSLDTHMRLMRKLHYQNQSKEE